ncbi:hypothetical protein CYMTET_28598, partial [Cymbomonas tetramitiformis]
NGVYEVVQWEACKEGSGELLEGRGGGSSEVRKEWQRGVAGGKGWQRGVRGGSSEAVARRQRELLEEVVTGVRGGSS